MTETLTDLFCDIDVLRLKVTETLTDLVFVI